MRARQGRVDDGERGPAGAAYAAAAEVDARRLTDGAAGGNEESENGREKPAHWSWWS